MKATGTLFLLGSIFLAHSVLASSPQSRLEDEEYRVYDSLIPEKFLNKKERGVFIEIRTTLNAGKVLILFIKKRLISKRVSWLVELYVFLGLELGGFSLDIL